MEALGSSYASFWLPEDHPSPGFPNSGYLEIKYMFYVLENIIRILPETLKFRIHQIWFIVWLLYIQL